MRKLGIDLLDACYHCILFWQWLASFTTCELIILRIILGLMRNSRSFIGISVEICLVTVVK